MNRRDFFKSGALAGIGAALWSPFSTRSKLIEFQNQAKNIIFLVSDGMSSGTLQMADLLRRRMDGRNSNWMQLYHDDKVTRSLMEMSSRNSSVPDSAAAGSSWGSGYRVNNGALNMGPEGEVYKPVLQKFKQAGKSVGCVTTVQITHATPASFLISTESRGEQAKIAQLYEDHEFDVLMGGGYEYFDSEFRADGRDLLAAFRKKGYQVALNREELGKITNRKPVLGLFGEGGLPYTLDQLHDRELYERVPSLAEMTQKAIDVMKNNPNGFAMQVEAGKVDWAAHDNDLGALLFDQLAFDDAVKVALNFAEADGQTLVIITTDHGNANPGLFSGRKADENFDRVQGFKSSFRPLLRDVKSSTQPADLVELLESALGFAIDKNDAKLLLSYFEKVKKEEEGAGPARIPSAELAKVLYPYTNVGWAGTSHTADFVELAMYGPGSKELPAFMKNTELHHYMLRVAGLS